MTILYCYCIIIVMTATIAITSNWQLHVPVAARKMLRMKKPGVVTVRAKSGQMIITPKKSKILTLGGSLNKNFKRKPVDVDKIRDFIDYS